MNMQYSNRHLYMQNRSNSDRPLTDSNTEATSPFWTATETCYKRYTLAFTSPVHCLTLWPSSFTKGNEWPVSHGPKSLDSQRSIGIPLPQTGVLIYLLFLFQICHRSSSTGSLVSIRQSKGVWGDHIQHYRLSILLWDDCHFVWALSVRTDHIWSVQLW